jgi:hypothetical protein
MTNRFYSPFPQFFDSTPTPRSGARLFFYVAGSSTKQNTYSNTGLSIANDNPLTLNALGQPDTDIYLSDLPYKIVLAPAGSDDPPNSPIWTADNFSIPSATAKFNSGSGNPTGFVAGTAGSVGVPANVYWDYTNAVLYVCTTTGIAARRHGLRFLQRLGRRLRGRTAPLGHRLIPSLLTQTRAFTGSGRIISVFLSAGSNTLT